MNKMKILYAICSILFVGCMNFIQERGYVVIKNYSDRSIDSIHIPITNDIQKILVPPGAQRKIEVLIPGSTKHKSGLSISIFQNGVEKIVSYGYCDPGFDCVQTDTVISVFNHGITTNNGILNEPTEFLLYLFDKTSKRIDSVTVGKGILIKEGDTNGKKFILNYGAFKLNPVLNIYLHGSDRNFQFRIEHDWNNWNSYEQIVDIFDKDIRYSDL